MARLQRLVLWWFGTCGAQLKAGAEAPSFFGVALFRGLKAPAPSGSPWGGGEYEEVERCKVRAPHAERRCST